MTRCGYDLKGSWTRRRGGWGTVCVFALALARLSVAMTAPSRQAPWTRGSNSVAP